MTEWISEHIIEIFGAAAGVIYVFLEIRQNIFLWPVGIVTSAVYIYVFAKNGFYAGMTLQGYYLVISIYGWYKWKKTQTSEHRIRRLDRKTAMVCLLTAIGLWAALWFSLDRWTDSPVPLWDGLITSLSVVATWMLTRRIIEQWYVWIAANAIAVAVYTSSGMYPTSLLFLVYLLMAIIGLNEWRKSYS